MNQRVIMYRAGTHVSRQFRWFCVVVLAVFGSSAYASEHQGQVTFNGFPVPDATITVTQGTKTLTTVADIDGRYAFVDLADGQCKIDIEMPLFVPIKSAVTIAPGIAAIHWELKMLPLAQVMAKAVTPASASSMAHAEEATVRVGQSGRKVNSNNTALPPDKTTLSNDGLLVNGSVNNAATSEFTLAQGFGNTRGNSRSLYSGGLGVIYDSSALDARPYSLTGFDIPKSSYSTITGVATLGGALRIPHLLPQGPNFFVDYQWTRSGIATDQSGLVPTLEQRNRASIDPVAAALTALYPQPNVAGNATYNYQAGVLAHSHLDVLQSRLDKTIGRRDELYGSFAFQSVRADTTSLFGFRDNTDTLGMNATAHWQHRLNQGVFTTLGYSFSRLRTVTAPYFSNLQNIEGAAGIHGADTSSISWGPPTLIFASGIAPLTDVQSAFDRNRTDAISPSVRYYHGHHNISIGGDFRRQEFNYFSQLDPRGTFTFTGAATGSDFTDFASGIPDTSSVNYGNADKYLRQSVYDAYVTDDWRLQPDLTLNIGLRWEYGAPITELKNRLVNLDVTPNFAAVAPVLASNPTGSLTGQTYPTSLLRPDRRDVEPRLGVAWRPLPGSSLLLRAGYGIYADTSVYQATALQLAEQPPLSNVLSAQNSTTCGLTLANGLIRQPCTATTPNTFAVDPNFRVGYAQTWQISAQRDLPFALQMTATYLGVKGTRGVQEFLPNTYPLGGTNPCRSCPSGFIYRTSNGDSTREAGSLQLRRRLRGGLAGSLLYTYSKSIDDDAVLGGEGPIAAGATSQSAPTASIAQNWLDLTAERGLSTFDQRQLLNVNFQYTTGTGIGGGTMLSGWRGLIYKEWTVAGQIAAGSGLPETPIYLAAANGSGITGSLRPDRTSASIYRASPGHFLNAAAYTAPLPGQWGNAGRDSIIGPASLTCNASLSRTFRVVNGDSLDIQVDAENVMNHVVFTTYNTTINPTLLSPIFGLPASTDAMRSVQTTVRLRF